MSTPLSDLPKQYDHAAAQQRWYRFWEEKGYFHSQPNSAKKPYTIVIPPPNVTGALHLGHALNNTLQDILIRRKRMQGFETLWLPGTDHAGIATQAVVERRLLAEEKLSRHQLGRDGLVDRIWQWKKAYETRILGQLKQMGCSCDWQRTRFTLDAVLRRAVRHTFFSLFRDRLIYRGKRLVNWDTMLQTAVSDDEVFHEEVAGHFWYFNYPVIDPRPGEPAHVTIATTRPETMLGDTAVAVHPDPAAALAKAEADLEARLAAAPAKQKPELEAELDDVRQRRQTKLLELLKLRDMALAGRKVWLPLAEREIPLVADVWAKPELGTGCVKITPAHDPNDYEVGLRQKLPMVNILNLDGTLSDQVPEAYRGQTVLVARQNVAADLDKLGLLVKVEDRQIDLAHSDRSKAPIEPLLTDQWFVSMERLAQTAIDAVAGGRVKIIPERYTKGYVDWLSEKRDWPISRQLWWGHQIPIWYCKKATEAELRTRLCRPRRRRSGSATSSTGSGSSAPRRKTFPTTPSPAIACLREQDVLDTWFSSALWPHSTLGWPEQTAELKYYYPTSVLITSRDIITLWVARMVITGLYNVGEVPFHDVFIHPKILDGYGEGMSKSKGNGVDPLDVIEKFGADSLRFGLAYLTTETQDIRMPVEFECPHCHALIEQTKENRVRPRIKCQKCGQEFSTQWAEKPADVALPRGAVVSDRFELARNFCNKLWNAARFSLMNLEGYVPGAVADAELTVEDRWILSRLATVTADAGAALDEYRYADAARVLYGFAWDEFCSFYLEMVKARLGDESARPVAQRILAHVLDNLLRLLQPMTPFVTEEIWQLLAAVAPRRGLDAVRAGGREHHDRRLAAMRRPPPRRADRGPICALSRRVAGGARHSRPPERAAPDADRLLRPLRFGDGRPVAADGAVLRLDGRRAADGLGAGREAPAGSADVALPGMEIFVDLSDLIDVAAERKRKEEDLAKLDGLIAAKRKKLENKSFVDRAPAAVVQGERDSLKDLEDRRAAVAAFLERLAVAGG